MPNRELKIGDRVVIRPSCEVELLLGDPRAAGLIEDVLWGGKHCKRRWFLCRFDVGTTGLWPSEVRLADGAAERADLRFEKRAAEIEAMKRARRKKPRRQKPGPRSVGATVGGTGCQSALDSTHDRQEVRPGPSQDSQNASHQRQARRKPACVPAGASG